MARMKIFNSLEEETFENPPIFNSVERKKFFDFPTSILDLVTNFKTTTNKIYFLVMFGYFKARRKFFFQKFYPADITWVGEKLKLELNQIDNSTYANETYYRHQKLILDFFNFRKFEQQETEFLKKSISFMVKSQVKPKQILLEIVSLLIREKIEIPSYNLLANAIVEQLNLHQQELINLIEVHLTDDNHQLLDSLLDKDTSSTNPQRKFQIERAKLTMLKYFSHSTKPSKIKSNIADLQILQKLYQELKVVICAINLSPESIRYYANIVIKSELFQVSRRADEDRYLHLIAFIVHQFFRLQDLLADALLHSVQNTLNVVKREHKEKYYEERKQKHSSLKKIVDSIDKNIIGVLADIKGIIYHLDFDDTNKVNIIKQLLQDSEPQKNLVVQHLVELKNSTDSVLQDKDSYSILELKSVKLQNRVSPIVKQLDFDPETSNSMLIKAITHYQQKGGRINHNAPIEFLETPEKELVFNDKEKLKPSIYKALLFIHTAESIKSGALNLKNSYKYRSLNDYLISKEKWQEEKAQLLKQADLTAFVDCQKTLQSLSKTLDSQYHKTNKNIINGKNLLVKFRANGTFYVETPAKKQETEVSSLSRFFPERKYVSLLEILATVNKVTGFTGEFSHHQHKYNRAKPSDKTFYAGIIGLGCDIGDKKIAQISQQINENELETTLNGYFYLSNIQSAIDGILSFVNKLELPNIYRLKSKLLHTSSDGQKFEVATDSLNANYSFKYFGKGKGATVYSFIDERHLLFHSTVISSAEKEAHYAIDGLMHNDVIKSDIHSTDTAGYSEIIFGAMHLLGFSFAPRIKKFEKLQLCSFAKRKVYEQLHYKILPDNYIDTELIETHWDDILRFIATIKLKHTTASQLFKRLNSYSKQHDLYRALKEFGKIIKSIFLLNYIDDVSFRQAIEKQLNKIESSQKFAKAISFGHNNEFIQAEKEEQEIAEACRRLIKNAVICWNYLYLSKNLKEEKSTPKKIEMIRAIKNGSVVTWQHINLHGEYDFSEEKMQDSVGLLTSQNFDLNLNVILGA
ncbi:MAG: transposase Tn3 family protein [bacterium]|nr:MAG: transposase Tn3 family protein [bacterium]